MHENEYNTRGFDTKSRAAQTSQDPQKCLEDCRTNKLYGRHNRYLRRIRAPEKSVLRCPDPVEGEAYYQATLRVLCVVC